MFTNEDLIALCEIARIALDRDKDIPDDLDLSDAAVEKLGTKLNNFLGVTDGKPKELNLELALRLLEVAHEIDQVLHLDFATWARGYAKCLKKSEGFEGHPFEMFVKVENAISGLDYTAKYRAERIWPELFRE